ncbi:MAG: hypothetical protein JXX28_12790 [Deltaproteobacteria bacterium]|nr:hypothetical protein [Deltaproteobacteria bacterium]
MRRALRLGAVAALLGAGTACSTLSTLHGARTLDPGQTQVGVALSVQQGGNALSNAGIPLPQTELALRVGLAEDVDVGARLYLLGAGMDARYRFYHQGRWHLAVDPGISGFWIPIGGLAKQGSVETQVPVIAELELGDNSSWSLGPRVVLRDQFNGIDDDALGAGSVARLDVFAGAGTRLELRHRRLVLGVSGDLLGQPARHGGPAWSAGVDFSLKRPK